MKILTYLMFIPFLSVGLCGGDDDECEGGRVNYIQNNSLVTVQANSNHFGVGDTLWINTIVNKNQFDITSNSEVNLFDIDKELSLGISYERASAYEQYFQINLNEDAVVSDKGQVIINNFILVQEGNNFVNRSGIKLLEAGNFRITDYDINSYKIDGRCSDPRSNIGTTISNANNGEFYEFSVE